MRYEVVPRPYVRMTQKSKHTDKAKRYHAWKQELQLLGLEVPNSGARIQFILPMPKSWSAGKRYAMDGKPHEQTPDIDNLLKGLLDAARYNVGDHNVWYIDRLSKVWGETGAIEITFKYADRAPASVLEGTRWGHAL